MPKDLWLPRNLQLPDGSSVGSLLFSGEDWQVFETLNRGRVLLARTFLVQKWTVAGFIADSLLGDIRFGVNSFRILSSDDGHLLGPVSDCKSPENKADALAFSLALMESRKISDSCSFHDAIYVEKYSRLLPTWTLTPQIEDAVVLGTWVSGGVAVSTDSFRRLSKLVGWMPASDLADVVEAAGLHVRTRDGFFARRKPHPLDEEKAASANVKPATQTMEGFRQRSEPAKKFSLPGRPLLEAFFNEHVVDIIMEPERYEKLGIEFPSAIVLHGPPGCGKTFAVERLVEFIDWPSFSIDSNSVGSPFIHDTSKKISQVFDRAIDAAPSVLIIDEMESFLSDRRSDGPHNLHHIEEVAEFLRRIPDAIKSRVLIVAMTNMVEMIDPAILRRGRFDHVVEVGMPSQAEVAALLDALLAKLPLSDDLILATVSDALTGKPLSDVAFVVREAARLAAKDGKTALDQASIDLALACSSRSTQKQRRPIGFLRDS